MMKSGIYEQVINKVIARELERSDLTDWVIKKGKIDEKESSKILAKYISEIIEKNLDFIIDKSKKIESQIDLINKLIDVIKTETKDIDIDELSLDDRAEQLLSLINKTNTMHALSDKEEIIRPETSIAVSSLFTGALHEPSMFSELKKEIMSSDKVDMLVSFIKWSGLRLIYEELKSFTQNGGKLRIITTSYMGATDIKAIEELHKLPNTQIKISYDTKRTRLHAKTYVFYRCTGFTTAYVGSSNLSNAAISSGLEWNVKVTAKDLPDTIKKIDATYDCYWNANEFELYSEKHLQKLDSALKSEKTYNTDSYVQYMFDIRPYPYQQEILDKIDAERKFRGHFNNLIVAATGTGKTVISAFDYMRFCNENIKEKNRILFIAHREEILKQSIDCFRGVLKNANFGELFVGSQRPKSIDHLFISIQTFNSQDFHLKTSPEFYDYIIVDEFHHAAAKTYQKLLLYYKPKILLGLTATPERMDGKSVIEYFDNRIAAEIRLPEAIDRKLLTPFQYFGVTDTVNLDELKWVRGGYEKAELTKIYSMNLISAKKRASMIVESVFRYVTDINEVIGLGFCVSIEHANFMSDYFNSRNIPSISLTGLSDDGERNTAKARLVSRELRFIFVVDIYNEGVDIPEVNTILFLRPTESLTVFLQQIGRGLRLANDKECLTVLDFIGQANKKYNFEDKYTALLSNTEKSVEREIKNGFISVPKGCYIQLEQKAKEYILNNIRSSFNNKMGLISRISSFEEDTGLSLNIENFCNHYHLDVRYIYKSNSFSRLSVLAGVREDFNDELEETMTKAFSRISSIDSIAWINFLLTILPNLGNVNFSDFKNVEKRMLQMLYVTIWSKSAENLDDEIVKNNFKKLIKSKVMIGELIELLKYKIEKIDIISKEADIQDDIPLELYCNYSMFQISTAMEYFKYAALQGIGVKSFKNKNIDIFFITLNKAHKDYSPTTMYDDYSIDEWLFHWQSQSTTSEKSVTGQRYINHKKYGIKILLFVREFKTDIAGTAPYTFLGLADYVSHEGNRPMSIIWKMHDPIPAKFLKKTNKLVVG